MLIQLDDAPALSLGPVLKPLVVYVAVCGQACDLN